MAEQNFANHTRLVPLFHFFALPVLGINFIWSLFRLRTLEFSFAGIFGVLLAAALILVALLSRLFALKVQDRVIRLEERLRCARLLPPDLQPRIEELDAAQMVSLRFASDAELPELTRRVLSEKLTNRKAIKQLIKVWRPDYHRA